MKLLSRLYFSLQRALLTYSILFGMQASAEAGPLASNVTPRCITGAGPLPFELPIAAKPPAPAFELLREIGMGTNADLFGLLPSTVHTPLMKEPAKLACTCCPPAVCPHAALYWKSKPGLVWPTPYSRTALFFSSGLTWQQILETQTQESNTYLTLAQQYIAAVLNRAAGGETSTSSLNIINSSTAWFSRGARFDSCPVSACATQKLWTKVLDSANHGLYARAGAACTAAAC